MPDKMKVKGKNGRFAKAQAPKPHVPEPPKAEAKCLKHLYVAYFSPYEKPLGARVVVIFKTMTAYHPDPESDRLAAEGKIPTMDVFDGQKPQNWARANGLAFEKRPASSEELEL